MYSKPLKSLKSPGCLLVPSSQIHLSSLCFVSCRYKLMRRWEEIKAQPGFRAEIKTEAKGAGEIA